MRSEPGSEIADLEKRAGNLSWFFFNGLLRFPFTLLYCLFGVVLAVFLSEHPDFAARVPAQHPDYLVPMFVLQYMSTGVVGLVMVAIFAASMSSFDSAFNSMSAVTARNIFGGKREMQHADGSAELTIGRSRLYTVAWGVLCTAPGYAMSRTQLTVIELINMIGLASASYPPPWMTSSWRWNSVG